MKLSIKTQRLISKRINIAQRLFYLCFFSSSGIWFLDLYFIGFIMVLILIYSLLFLFLYSNFMVARLLYLRDNIVYLNFNSNKIKGFKIKSLRLRQIVSIVIRFLFFARIHSEEDKCYLYISDN
jgi:hypothetical protein